MIQSVTSSGRFSVVKSARQKREVNTAATIKTGEAAAMASCKPGVKIARPSRALCAR